MSAIWVLAADSSEARLFSREKRYSALVEQQDWLHPESRLPARDLEDDRQGRTFASQGYGQSDMQKRTAPKQREASEFARTIADFLNQARARGVVDTLLIVAEPSFLGLLREHMDPNTRALVERAVARGLTRQAPEVIAKAVDEVG
ncbi:MAG: host attachment protein [Wenzhouxiangellaceae bacterium]